MQGRLGHQVLGQLLVAQATELEIAGAQLAFAATAGQRNAVAQVAIRTALPTLAIRGLLRKDQARLLRLRRLMLENQMAAAATGAAPAAAVGRSPGQKSGVMRLRRLMLQERVAAEARGRSDRLEHENRRLQAEVASLRARLAAAPVSPTLAREDGDPPGCGGSGSRRGPG